MLIHLLVARLAFDKQILEQEKNYLSVAMKIVRNEMISKKNNLKKAGEMLANDPNVQLFVTQNNRERLQLPLRDLLRTYPFIDYAVIVNLDNEVILKRQESMIYEGGHIAELAQEAMHSRIPVASEEVVNLKDLYVNNSKEYNVFKVKNNEMQPNQEEYFTKALMGTVIMPIENVATGQIVGAFILGDIVNNDPYFPNYYSEAIEDSFLAISIDGIRIAANINYNVGQNYIGSQAPQGISYIKQGEHQYFGKVRVEDAVHVFLDEKIVNYRGEEVAVIGIGIPEEKFASIVTDNNIIVVIVGIISLVIMLVVGNVIASKISTPIVEITNRAKKFSEEKLHLISNTTSNKKDEVQILWDTFDKFVNDLNYHQHERQKTMLQLKTEHEKQSELAQKLKISNEKLEQTVAIRTKSLQEAICELKKVDIAKSHFMANISHELRTPLNAIIGSSEILQETVLGELNPRQLGYVKSIQSSGSHLLQLINDILDISKIATGKMNFNLNEFYVGDLIKQTVNEIRSYLKEKNLQISVIMEPEDFLINADAKKLKQIMYNLLSNAVKFTPAGGKVDLIVYKRADVMEVIVRDTGIGIAEEDQERVFIEFEQVDNSYSREYEGTGLGLPLVRKLVSMHSGVVSLKSKVGVGTEVMFTIPIDQGNNK